MNTINIEIVNKKALPILKVLKRLKLIRFKNVRSAQLPIDFVRRYKGVLSKQPLHELDQQLKELRDAWG